MRECGTCQACCTTIAVVALGKPQGVRCRYLTDQGCGIYETRPEECRRYYCLWADPNAQELNLPEWGRPDRTEVILQASQHDLNAKDAVIVVLPLSGSLPEKGSRADYWGQKLLKQRRLRSFPMVLR